MPIIFTVGHSNHTMEKFIGLLKRHQVTAIADVRSVPFSGFNPHFNQQALEASLRREGISYVYLGKELGARRDEPECFVGGQAKYERVAKLPKFREGIERLKKGAQDQRIALMCAEKDPITCHRTVLVARALLRESIDVQHILEDGRLESASEAEERMMDATETPRSDLFQSREDLVNTAYQKLGEELAWVNEGDGSSTH
ncbi:MAG: DUF488 domain-containing protein [Planctomycetes bacterium]|nr:DUF488 domain-containing protein [Planctomycetota bacterium]